MSGVERTTTHRTEVKPVSFFGRLSGKWIPLLILIGVVLLGGVMTGIGAWKKGWKATDPTLTTTNKEVSIIWRAMFFMGLGMIIAAIIAIVLMFLF